MTPSRRRQVLYVLLGLAVVWGVYNFKKPRPSTARATSTAAPVRPAPPASTATDQINVAASMNRPWGTDPFRVRSRTTEPRTPGAAPSWRLSGILYNDNQPLAIINSRPVGVGDRIDGAIVLDINKRHVTLEADGRRFSITVAARG